MATSRVDHTYTTIGEWVYDSMAGVASILILLSMIMGEAVEERRIALNPCRKLRGASPHRPERPWATAAQVNKIAARPTPANQALIITAAYTGMRWGELTGLRRPNCKLDDGRIVIDPDTEHCTSSPASSNSAPRRPPPPSATSSCPSF